MRFDPSSRPIWSVAVLPDASKGKPMSAIELTNWADQVLTKRLENVRGVGSITLVGGTKREINVYLNPVAMEALGVTPDQVAAAVAQREPGPAGRRDPLAGAGPRGADVGAHGAARGLRQDHRGAQGRSTAARRAGAGGPGGAGGRRRPGAGQPGPVQRRAHAAADGAEVAGREHHPGGRRAAARRCRRCAASCRPALRLEPIMDASRPIRVAVSNVRETLIEGALLTVLIVFLFLNSWRSTVITGLTLPIALIGTFLFMYLFGFTINMVTLMALSLCVGLLIDDAIVVRENIVRHVQMGKTAFQAALDGTQEIGLAVLATTLSIVAVFLPIGFMGGIIGKFFHEFGVTIVAAVLISMFVSFTLDPMLSSIWHDPAIARPRQAHRQSQLLRPHHRPRHRLVRPGHRGAVARLPGHPALGAGAPAGHGGAGGRGVRHQRRDGAAAGHRVRPQGRLLGDHDQFLHAGGLVAGGHRSQGPAGRSHHPRVSRGALHAGDPQHRHRPGQDLRVHLCPAGRPGQAHAQRRHHGGGAARAPQAGAGHHRDPRRPARHGGRQQADRVLAHGPGPEGAGAAGGAGERAHPHRARPGRPGLQRQARQAGDRGGRQARRRVRPGPVGGADRRCAAHPGGRPDGGQLARARRPDLRRERAAARPRRGSRRRTWSGCRSRWAATPTAAPASCG